MLELKITIPYCNTDYFKSRLNTGNLVEVWSKDMLINQVRGTHHHDPAALITALFACSKQEVATYVALSPSSAAVLPKMRISETVSIVVVFQFTW